MVEQVVMDWGLLERLCGDQPEFMRHLIELYLEDAQKDRSELRAACERCALGQIDQVAHRMRGAAKTMGAQRIAVGCLQLQTAASAADPARVASAVSTLEAEFETLYALLHGRLKSLPPHS